MNLSELQADLRHFAAERDWQRFHTPKNLSTALMVEAAELAEIFQWMTPEDSQDAHRDLASKQRIGDEVREVDEPDPRLARDLRRPRAVATGATLDLAIPPQVAHRERQDDRCRPLRLRLGGDRSRPRCGP